MRNGIRFLGLSWTGFLKWVVGVLLATFVIWLGLNDGYRSAEGEKKMPSSTREKSRKDRVKSASEPDLTAMERLAAGLSDEELWEGLEKACESCFDANAKRKWRDQPRYAIVLSREMGKRKGETGMKEVSTWIKQRFKGMSEEEMTSEAIDFFEMRVRTAAFGGWVSDRPEEAISRFVESRRLEESGWPIVNQGHAFLGGVPRASERGAVEMILRHGFQQMASEDLETAYRLFSEGVEAWAFNPKHVMEALIQQTAGMERKEFLAELVKVSSWQEVLLREKDMQGLKEVKEEEGVQRIREIKGEEDFLTSPPGCRVFPTRLV